MTARSAPNRVRRGLGAVVALGAAGLLGCSTFGGYTIRSGDTLSGLASRFHVSPSSLAAVNHIVDPNRIYIGRTLIVPVPPSPTTTVAVPAPPLAAVAIPPPGPPMFPAGLVARPARLAMRASFQHWAAVYGLSAGLLEAVGWMESGWQTTVVSYTGAIGVGQIEPQTAVFVSTQLLGLPTPLDPRAQEPNIHMSAAYLAWLLHQTHGDVANAVGAYYQGLGALRANGPLTSTRRYVAGVGALWGQFRSG